MIVDPSPMSFHSRFPQFTLDRRVGSGTPKTTIIKCLELQVGNPSNYDMQQRLMLCLIQCLPLRCVWDKG